MLKEPCHLHNLYAGQWKFGRASRIYITLVRWASRLEMLISTPGGVMAWTRIFRYVCTVTLQSSTLTTGPKVLVSKNWLGLVEIGNLEVRRAYKHFTVACYTSLNLSPTGGMVVSCYVLTRKKQNVLQMVQRNHVTDLMFDVSLHSIFVKWEHSLREIVQARCPELVKFGPGR